MPQIKIVSAPTDSSNSSELFLLEFQGKFETSGNISLNGMEIGKLDLSGVNQFRILDSFVLIVFSFFRINQFITLEISDSSVKK